MNRALLVGLVVSLAIGCGDDEKKSTNNTTNNATNNVTNNGTTSGTNNQTDGVSFVTYNVGLASGFVALADARRQPVADALAGLDADVVCLQEVWLNQDAENVWKQDNIDAIVTATATNLPHSYYFISEDETKVGCEAADIVDVDACVQTNCPGVTADGLQDCVLGSCQTEFFALPSDCSQCLVGQLGNEYEDIKTACVGGAQSAFFSNAHNGLLLLSKYPLSNTEHTPFFATQVARSVLKADVALPTGNQRVYCTHLSADIRNTEYPQADGSDITSYAEEQAKQIDDMGAMVAAEPGSVIIMGDMNAGPSGTGVDAELPENYTKFTTLGWSSAYISLAAYECTFCEVNTLVTESGDKTIDHIFSSDASWTAHSAKRIFTEPVDVDGEQQNLSDHFGLQAELYFHGEL